MINVGPFQAPCLVHPFFCLRRSSNRSHYPLRYYMLWRLILYSCLPAESIGFFSFQRQTVPYTWAQSQVFCLAGLCVVFVLFWSLMFASCMERRTGTVIPTGDHKLHPACLARHITEPQSWRSKNARQECLKCAMRPATASFCDWDLQPWGVQLRTVCGGHSRYAALQHPWACTALEHFDHGGCGFTRTLNDTCSRGGENSAVVHDRGLCCQHADTMFQVVSKHSACV